MLGMSPTRVILVPGVPAPGAGVAVTEAGVVPAKAKARAWLAGRSWRQRKVVVLGSVAAYRVTAVRIDTSVHSVTL